MASSGIGQKSGLRHGQDTDQPLLHPHESGQKQVAQKKRGGAQYAGKKITKAQTLTADILPKPEFETQPSTRTESPITAPKNGTKSRVSKTKAKTGYFDDRSRSPQARSLNPTSDYAGKVDSVAKKLSEAEAKGIEDNPVQWCIAISKEIQDLRSSQRTGKGDNRLYLQEKLAPYYCKALEQALTAFEEISKIKIHEHISELNDIINLAYLHPTACTAGAPVNTKIKERLKFSIESEVGYLVYTKGLPDKRCIKPVISKIQWLLGNQAPAMYFNFLTSEEKEYYFHQIEESQKIEVHKAYPENSFEKAIKDKNFKKATQWLESAPKTRTRHGKLRYLGDMLMLELSKTVELPLRSTNFSRRVALVQQLINFKARYLTIINTYNPLQNSFYTVLSAEVSRIIVDLQSAPEEQQAGTVATIKNIIMDPLLADTCKVQWQRYQHPESQSEHSVSIIEAEAYKVLNEAFDAIRPKHQKDFDKAASLVRPLFIKIDEVMLLPTGKTIRKNMEHIRPLIGTHFFNPIIDHYFRLIRMKPYHYNSAIEQMAQYKEVCISYEKYRFVLTDTIDKQWQGVLWKVWGITARDFVKKTCIDHEDLIDLLKLRSLAEIPQCIHTRLNLKNALINLFTQAMTSPETFSQFQEELYGLARWTETLCHVTEKKYTEERQRDTKLQQLTQRWLSKSIHVPLPTSLHLEPGRESVIPPPEATDLTSATSHSDEETGTPDINIPAITPSPIQRSEQSDPTPASGEAFDIESLTTVTDASSFLTLPWDPTVYATGVSFFPVAEPCPKSPVDSSDFTANASSEAVNNILRETTADTSIQAETRKAIFPKTRCEVLQTDTVLVPTTTLSIQTDGELIPTTTLSTKTDGELIPTTTLSTQTDGELIPTTTLSTQTDKELIPTTTLSTQTDEELIPTTTLSTQTDEELTPATCQSTQTDEAAQTQHNADEEEKLRKDQSQEMDDDDAQDSTCADQSTEQLKYPTQEVASQPEGSEPTSDTDSESTITAPDNDTTLSSVEVKVKVKPTVKHASSTAFGKNRKQRLIKQLGDTGLKVTHRQLENFITQDLVTVDQCILAAEGVDIDLIKASYESWYNTTMQQPSSGGASALLREDATTEIPGDFADFGKNSRRKLNQQLRGAGLDITLRKLNDFLMSQNTVNVHDCKMAAKGDVDTINSIKASCESWIHSLQPSPLSVSVQGPEKTEEATHQSTQHPLPDEDNDADLVQALVASKHSEAEDQEKRARQEQQAAILLKKYDHDIVRTVRDGDCFYDGMAKMHGHSSVMDLRMKCYEEGLKSLRGNGQIEIPSDLEKMFENHIEQLKNAKNYAEQIDLRLMAVVEKCKIIVCDFNERVMNVVDADGGLEQYPQKSLRDIMRQSPDAELFILETESQHYIGSIKRYS